MKTLMRKPQIFSYINQYDFYQGDPGDKGDLGTMGPRGPPGQKGDQGATEIIDYNGNIHEALQVFN
ncbi:Collagen alpha-1(XXV) chain [Varanus komodoensis]|nr:Collagen alpha-1(XXV) chain [Varanus komodoensis]